MADTELVDVEMSEQGEICVAKIMEVIAALDLTSADGAMVAGEIFAWVHLVGFLHLGKEKVLEQMDRSFEASRRWANDSFDGFKARAAIIASLDRGESGGWMQ